MPARAASDNFAAYEQPPLFSAAIRAAFSIAPLIMAWSPDSGLFLIACFEH
jgi:hypothetical protein